MPDIITGVSLVSQIFGPIFKEIFTGISKDDQLEVDQYIDKILNAFDRLDPAIRAAVALELQKEMDQAAEDTVRKEYIKVVKNRLEYLKALKALREKEAGKSGE